MQGQNSSHTARVAIFGAAGRMGEALLRFHDAVANVKVCAGVLRPDHELVGEDASRIFGGRELNIPLVSGLDELLELREPVHAVVDFSRPHLTMDIAKWCLKNNVALVTGTTGFSQAQKEELQSIAKKIPIVHSNNMSPGVNLCFELVQDTARKLGDQVDVEIVEAHHKHKVDAPSGTALRLGEAVAAGWGVELQDRAVYVREGHTGPRKSGTIGFATVRAGDIIGDHYVIFAADGERIEIVHKSTSRVHYARGGLLAAAWLVQKGNGFYTMADVLK